MNGWLGINQDMFPISKHTYVISLWIICLWIDRGEPHRGKIFPVVEIGT